MLNATEIMELQKLAGMENFKKLTIPQFLARETLIELICSTEYGNGSLMGNNFQKGFIEKIADHLIDNDVVPVVRCKDCKQWKCHGMPFDITKGTCHNPRFHFHHGHVIDECFMPVTNETDFCSYGERRDNG